MQKEIFMNDLRIIILKHLHDHILKGLLNNKIIMAKQFVSWTGSLKQIENFIESCIACIHDQPDPFEP